MWLLENDFNIYIYIVTCPIKYIQHNNTKKQDVKLNMNELIIFDQTFFYMS